MDYDTIQQNMLKLTTSVPDYPVYSDEELEMWANWYRAHPRFRLSGISFVRFMWSPIAHCQNKYTGFPWSEPETVFHDGGHHRPLPAQRFAAASAIAPYPPNCSPFLRKQAD